MRHLSLTKKLNLLHGLYVLFIVAIVAVSLRSLSNLRTIGLGVGGGYSSVAAAPWRRETPGRISALAQAAGRRIALLGVLFLLLGSVVFRLLTRGVLASLNRLLDSARQIAGGDFAHRIRSVRSDEIGELSTAFNNMTEALCQTTFSKGYVENIMDAMLDALIVFDTGGRIKTVNRAAEDLLGYSQQELIGENIQILFNEHAEQTQVLHDLKIQQLLRTSVFRNLELVYRTKDGQDIPVSLSGSVMKDADGEVRGIVSIAHDLREIKHLIQQLHQRNDQHQLTIKTLSHREQELRSTQAMLVQAGKLTAMGELGAGIAHELNQPITAIQGYAQLILEEQPEGAPARDDLNLILQQAQRMAKIVNNVRTFARESKDDFARIDIHGPIEDALALVRVQLEHHHITVEKDFAPDLPRVFADHFQLQQVFINLIANARDALDERGGGRLWIRTRQVSTGRRRTDQRVAVAVGNEGGPIPAPVLEKVFDPFYTTKEVGRGTGLGLSISYGIIKKHRGSIVLNNVIGQGVEAVIELPCLLAAGDGS